MFKGIGEINGQGSYDFMLWAVDGDPDELRIRIWLENSNGAENAETVIYDNDVDGDGFGQAIDGGSIVIHKK